MLTNWPWAVNRIEELEAALRKLVEAAKWKEFDQELEDEDGCLEYCSVCDKATHKDYPQTCTFAAAIAEAERLLRKDGE